MLLKSMVIGENVNKVFDKISCGNTEEVQYSNDFRHLTCSGPGCNATRRDSPTARKTAHRTSALNGSSPNCAFIAKISADKGVSFNFTNNAKLKESGFAVDGKQVNGFVTKEGITLNIDSAKAMNATVGHEITHVLEGTEFYDSLKQTIFDYAKAKGEYQSRYDSLSELYKDIKDTDIEAELTTDLVGDYLFSDPDFINNLSIQNRNVFQKFFEEIKYLCKVVTAGSKEARELERVKRAFEQIWHESATGKNGAETRYSLENYGKGKYNKRSKYSESETLFMSWENGSAPVGEVKKFKRLGKIRYYEKTENGCVELSRSQYNERNGRNAEETYGRIQRQVNGIADPNGTSERNLSGSMDGDRGAGRTSAVSGQAFGEELRNDIAGSVSSIDGHDRRNGLAQTEYSDEASDESGASFVTFSNDYATIRNFMKEGDTKTDTVDGNQEIDNIAPVRSLSNEGQQHTPDSLSALRLEAPVYSEAELPYGAPVADDFTERSEASKPVSQMTEDDFAPMADSTGKNGVPDRQKAADAGAGKAVTRKEYHRRIIEDIKSKFKLRGFDFDEVLKNSKNLSTFCFPAYRCGGKRKTSA